MVTRADFRRIKAIDFFEAIETQNYKTICDDIDEFYEIIELYRELTGTDASVQEKVMNEFRFRITMISVALDLLDLQWTEAQANVIRKFNLRMEKETYDIDVADAVKAIKRLQYKLKKKTDKRAANTKDTDDNNIYDPFTQISNALGYDFDYDNITLLKFISLLKAVKNKNKNKDGR